MRLRRSCCWLVSLFIAWASPVHFAGPQLSFSRFRLWLVLGGEHTTWGEPFFLFFSLSFRLLNYARSLPTARTRSVVQVIIEEGETSHSNGGKKKIEEEKVGSSFFADRRRKRKREKQAAEREKKTHDKGGKKKSYPHNFSHI